MTHKSTTGMKSRIIFLFCFVISISANKCVYDVKLAQKLLDAGFHRNLTYSIVFGGNNHIERLMYSDCILGLDQPLPAGVFAGPDELSDLRRIHKVHAIPKSKVNVELPAEKSEPSSVFIISKVDEEVVQMWLPIHGRYHKAIPGGGTVKNEIGPPKMYMRCPDTRLEGCGKSVSTSASYLCKGSSEKRCTWKEIPYTLLSKKIIFGVPVGNTDHYNSVVIGTASAVTIGSLCLLYILHDYKVAARRKKLC